MAQILIEFPRGKALGVDDKEGSKSGEAGSNTRLGKYALGEEYPPMGKPFGSHEGSQSTSPTKEGD